MPEAKLSSFFLEASGFWQQTNDADCWYKCGSKGGLCEDVCGPKGYCCRKGYDDCPVLAANVSPIRHTCVSQGCLIEERISYYGYDLEQFKNVPSKEECAEKAAAVKDAKFWTYKPKSKTCYSKTSMEGKKANPDGVSGNVECANGQKGECTSLEKLVNKERQRGGLAPLHCDPHMRWVAERHLDDADEAVKKNIAFPKERGCKAHSWLTTVGGLLKSACCYHENYDCMWKKPLELSGWDDREGYEISVGDNDHTDFKMTAEYAINSWKKSPPHHNVIMGRGEWSELKTVGCNFRNHIAHCWFSKKKI